MRQTITTIKGDNNNTNGATRAYTHTNARARTDSQMTHISMLKLSECYTMSTQLEILLWRMLELSISNNWKEGTKIVFTIFPMPPKTNCVGTLLKKWSLYIIFKKKKKANSLTEKFYFMIKINFGLFLILHFFYPW